jgi:putative transposase
LICFTVGLADGRSRALVEAVGARREAARTTMVKGPFRIDAWVVLPDLMHAVWT